MPVLAKLVWVDCLNKFTYVVGPISSSLPMDSEHQFLKLFVWDQWIHQGLFREFANS